MCPVAAESKNSNPSSKKKINKKIDSNLEKFKKMKKLSIIKILFKTCNKNPIEINKY